MNQVQYILDVWNMRDKLPNQKGQILIDKGKIINPVSSSGVDIVHAYKTQWNPAQ